MIFGSGIELILTGAILGTLGALATSRVMRQMLFEVKPADPLSLAGGAAVLIAIAALATYLPARRATKVDPMVTLRYE
jgi:ABC-type antimicrobial peptide transport system permease subunit